ncbi:hypothetical protein TWF481_007674 [Arthrobotrys musiformis]|uniref:RNase III domain-containing protein n=1 Tax=Arthrobotrys musiformis TaxID=47236 RepID=A0AAV9WCE4_9PEZI
MQRAILSTAKQMLKAYRLSKSNPVLHATSGKPKSQASKFSTSQTKTKKASLPLFQYPPGADVPIPPAITSRELQRLLRQSIGHQEVQTKYGTLSLKRLEQIGDVKYNAAIVRHLVKMQPQIAWPEMMYLRNVLCSNAQLNAFAKGMRTLDRVKAPSVTGVKRVADIQEAEFGAVVLERGRYTTEKFIQTLIDPAIPFHREVFRAHERIRT